jgi:hypothetical protein
MTNRKFFLQSLFMVIGSCLLLAIRPSAATAQSALPAPPPAVAFVVGIQNYDDNGLNKLNYTAYDALQVFRALQTVTNLRQDKSRILIAAKDHAKLPEMPGAPQYKKAEKVKWSELNDELRQFLIDARRLSKDHIIFIYFGGHGAVGLDADKQIERMAFLTSEYAKDDEGVFTGGAYLLRQHILGTIQTLVGPDQPVVVFLNACNSGGGGATEKREVSQEETKGKQRYLYPATFAKEDTFEHEKLQGSFFARALTESLFGAAAVDGIITSGSLGEALKKKLEAYYRDYKLTGLSLPAPALSKDDLTIANTSQVQSEEKGMLGVALATAARGSIHERMLHRLAALNFRQAGHLGAPNSQAEWYFAESASRVRAHLAPSILPGERRAIMPDEIANNVRRPLGAALRNALKATEKLKDPSPEAKILTEKIAAASGVFDRKVAYINLLLLPEEARPLVFDRGLAAGSPLPVSVRRQQYGNLLAALADNAGPPLDKPFEFVLKRSEEVGLKTDPTTNLTLAASRNLANEDLPKETREQLDKHNDGKTLLNVIFWGRSYPLATASTAIVEAQGSRVEEVSPVSTVLLANIAKYWKGNLNILFNSDYGGVIKRKFADEIKAKKISLLLTAQQDNGALNSEWDEPSTLETAKAFLSAVKNGVNAEKLRNISDKQKADWDDYALRSTNPRAGRELGGSRRDRDRRERGDESGRAEWVGEARAPFYNEFPELNRTAAFEQHLDWWAYYWGARGTRMAISVRREDVRPATSLRVADAERIFDGWQDAAKYLDRQADAFRDANPSKFWCTMGSLRRGFLHELASDRVPDHKRYYENFCGQPDDFTIEQGATQPRDGILKVRQMAANKFQELNQFLQELRESESAMAGKAPTVRFIILDAGNYASPHIPKLDKIEKDKEAWRATLLKALPVEERRKEYPIPPADGSNKSFADRVRETLKSAVAASGPRDLILFIYVGRGATVQGWPMLVPDDVQATIQWPDDFVFANRAQYRLCSDGPSEKECLSVQEIADLTQSHSLVAIFDTQFTPVSGQLASLVDKHAFPTNQSGEGDPSKFSSALKTYPRSETNPQAVMIWFEGRVPHIFSDGITESLTTNMLTGAFQGARTYDDVLSNLNRYPTVRMISQFRTARPGSPAQASQFDTLQWYGLARRMRENMRPAKLGETKRPLFAGGKDIEKLVSYAAQEDRSSVNVEIGAELAKAHYATAPDDPVVALSTVAALAVLADVTKGKKKDKAREYYADASTILERLPLDKVLGLSRKSDADPDYLFIDFLYWTKYVNGDQDIGKLEKALGQLESLEPEHVKADVSALLAYVLEELTGKTSRRAADKIDENRKKLQRFVDYYGLNLDADIHDALAYYMAELGKASDKYKKSRSPDEEKEVQDDRYATILDRPRQPALFERPLSFVPMAR